MAEELRDSKLIEWFVHRRGPLGVDMELVWSMRVASFNVETRASLAYGSRICMAAGGTIGHKSNDGRARTW